MVVEIFYRTHQYLLAHLVTPMVRRRLMDEINWNDRLIGIKGTRGVGKTTFLLAFAKEHYGISDRKCLYINLNHFFFSRRTLVDFVSEFHAQGGKTLLIDQVFKYPNWSKELRECYDRFEDLKIIFTGPAVMRLKEENPDLAGKVSVYYLSGFSFREYLNLAAKCQLKALSLENILENHHHIAENVIPSLKQDLQVHFKDYLHHGFYPFFLEKRNYSENLLKTMNMTLEVDVSHIKQIEQRYLPKLRKLLYLISLETPYIPNISNLSKELEISRLTVMNYIKYLKEARMLNLLYKVGEDLPKKPSKIFLYNTNIARVINQLPINEIGEHKTFFFNQLQNNHLVNEGKKDADFLIDGKLNFHIGKSNGTKNDSNYYAVADILPHEKDRIPIWLFGFLY